MEDEGNIIHVLVDYFVLAIDSWIVNNIYVVVDYICLVVYT